MKSDSQIQQDVIQELKMDPSVTHEHIGVAVANGIVTLAGTIPSYIEKFSAEKAAERVSGVKAVVEKIEVKLPGIHEKGDQELAQEVVNQLKWNVQVPDEMVKASVENGWVKLTGEVEWDYQRTATENSIRGLMGVRGVINHMTIKSKKIQPEIIKKKIEEALTREAEREARRISVEVSGGQVILSGKVHSFAEMQNVKSAAWATPGVISVENNLLIGP